MSARFTSLKLWPIYKYTNTYYKEGTEMAAKYLHNKKVCF